MSHATPSVRVWLLEPTTEPDRTNHWLGWLTSDERERHAAMVTAALAAEYLATRALVRFVLSGITPAVAPDEWRFARTEAGRPFVVGPLAPDHDFNLANAPGLVACVTGAAPVGIDVEPLADAPRFLASAATFSGAEQTELARLPPPARPVRALELWIAKEATVKALGTGIGRKPATIGADASLGVRLLRHAHHAVAVAFRGECVVELTALAADAVT